MRVNIKSLYIEDAVLHMTGDDGKRYKTAIAPIPDISEEIFLDDDKDNTETA